MTRLRFIFTLAFAFLSALVNVSTAASAQQKTDVTGKWAFAVVTDNGTGTPTVTFKQAGEKVTGTYDSKRLGVRALDGTVKGDTIRFVLKGGVAGMPDLFFEGVLVDANNMKGSLEMGGLGSATFTGTRQK